MLFLFSIPFGTQAQQQPQSRQDGVVRVLSIGNSFSRDAYAYTPFIIEELAPGMQVEIGIAYIGGCSLASHNENMKSNAPKYEFDYYKSGMEAWTTTPKKSLCEIVQAGQWDIITFQQQSGQSRYYSTFQPHLNELLAAVRRERPHATMAWLLTQAYGEGYEKLDGMSSEEMWARVANTAQDAVAETGIPMLIPAGTAIQNARNTVLDSLGRAKHLVYDGFHLHEGIPAYIEGLCAASLFLQHYGINVDIEDSRLQITPQWREARHTPQPHGKPQKASEEDYTLARWCAKQALLSPFQLTIVER